MFTIFQRAKGVPNQRSLSCDPEIEIVVFPHRERLIKHSRCNKTLSSHHGGSWRTNQIALQERNEVLLSRPADASLPHLHSTMIYDLCRTKAQVSARLPI